MEWKGCWKWCDGEERGGRRGKWWKMRKVVEEKRRKGRRGKLWKEREWMEGKGRGERRGNRWKEKERRKERLMIQGFKQTQ